MEEKSFKIGLRIKQARGSVSQKKFAQAIGVSATSLSHLENNVTTPKLETLYKIARVAEKSLDWLMERDWYVDGPSENIAPNGASIIRESPASIRSPHEALQQLKRARRQIREAEDFLSKHISSCTTFEKP